MRHPIIRAALGTLLVAMLATPSRGVAWNSLGLGAHITGIESAAQLCSNPFGGFAAQVNVNDPFAPTFSSQRLQARDAEANAYWMWLREGGLNPVWQWSATCAPFNTGTPGASWFDGSDEVNNNWYEITATINSGITAGCPAGGGAIGCTGLDFASPSFAIIKAADIVVSRDFVWNTVNQDTLRECLIPGGNHFEGVWLHELGHAYGIGHNDGVLATMNSVAGARRNCNLTQAYNDQPWPDDMSGMQFKYGTISGRHNLAASPWFGSAAAQNISDPAFKTGIGTDVHSTISSLSATVTKTFQYTLEKYWDGTAPDSVVVRFVLVPIGTLPSFNWTTQTWVFPAGSSTRWMLDPITTPMPESNSGRSTTITFQLSDVAPGNYRLFLQVDPSRLIAESDEGDNVIPLNFVLRRL
jgi:hypothetical protein